MCASRKRTEQRHVHIGQAPTFLYHSSYFVALSIFLWRKEERDQGGRGGTKESKKKRDTKHQVLQSVCVCIGKRQKCVICVNAESHV